MSKKWCKEGVNGDKKFSDGVRKVLNVVKKVSEDVRTDMENVMSVASAACENFYSFGKILAVNIRCLVKNTLFV